jgi:hypothetical protein
VPALVERAQRVQLEAAPNQLLLEDHADLLDTIDMIRRLGFLGGVVRFGHKQ